MITSSSASSTSSNSQSKFPQTVVAVSREEFVNPLPLNIRDAAGNEANLPKDLTGNYFLISPVGSVDSPTVAGDDNVVWVSKDGWTPLYNGDGMVYRLSFTEGQASLKTRLMKPPCYFADLAVSDPANGDRFRGLEFSNLGISRASPSVLGLRNQLNTAFLPFKLPKDTSDRLLVSWDVGRPYEIDPETLETLTPVGYNADWSNLLPSQPDFPFKNIISSAHPVSDPHTGRVFTLNVGKSTWTMLGLSRSLEARKAENKEALESAIADSGLSQNLKINLIRGYELILGLIGVALWFLKLFLDKILRFFGREYEYVHLLAWDGEEVSISQKWNLISPDNKPIKIDQTVHQMGITEKYIVFAETAFKFSLDNILPYQRNSLANSFKSFIADFINYPQYPNTKLYIIKRDDLESTNGTDLPQVVAREVSIAPEFAHFVVDYKNPDNQIVLHISHLAATDVAEYIHIFDRSVYDDRDLDLKYDHPDLTASLQKLAGSVVSPMDISRLGVWVIDGETGREVSHHQFPDVRDRDAINQQIVDFVEDPDNNQIDIKYQLPWSTAFYVYPDTRPTEQFTDLFWNSWGCWTDTLTFRTIEAYKNYPHRLVEKDNVVDLTYRGIPSNLSHVKINRTEKGTQLELNTDNYYQFESHLLGTSAQFVPRPNAEDQTDGYIVCVVLTSDRFLSQPQTTDSNANWSQNSEIWIFDAQNLRQGALYKLSHPQLNIGFSFHTTWLAEAKSPASNLEYRVRDDYQELVQKTVASQMELGEKVNELFEREIYPHFPD